MNTPCLSDPLAEAVRRLAHHSLRLEDLTADQLDALGRLVAAARLANDLHRRAQLFRISLVAERSSFLDQASPSGSAATVRAYAAALDRWLPWCRRRDLDPLDLCPRTADEYLWHLRAQGRSPSAVRLDAAALSAFFRYLERRHEAILNPFRGTRALPPERHRRPRVPRASELAVLLEAIGRAGLPSDRPFAAWTARQLGALVFSLSRRLRNRGQLEAQFSAHDLRHHFAVTEYRRSPDLYRLKGLLGHRSVASTERYLRSLDLED